MRLNVSADFAAPAGGGFAGCSLRSTAAGLLRSLGARLTPSHRHPLPAAARLRLPTEQVTPLTRHGATPRAFPPDLRPGIPAGGCSVSRFVAPDRRVAQTSPKSGAAKEREYACGDMGPCSPIFGEAWWAAVQRLPEFRASGPAGKPATPLSLAASSSFCPAHSRCLRLSGRLATCTLRSASRTRAGGLAGQTSQSAVGPFSVPVLLPPPPQQKVVEYHHWGGGRSR